MCTDVTEHTHTHSHTHTNKHRSSAVENSGTFMADAEIAKSLTTLIRLELHASVYLKCLSHSIPYTLNC